MNLPIIILVPKVVKNNLRSKIVNKSKIISDEVNYSVDKTLWKIINSKFSVTLTQSVFLFFQSYSHSPFCTDLPLRLRQHTLRGPGS